MIPIFCYHRIVFPSYHLSDGWIYNDHFEITNTLHLLTLHIQHIDLLDKVLPIRRSNIRVKIMEKTWGYYRISYKFSLTLGGSKCAIYWSHLIMPVIYLSYLFSEFFWSVHLQSFLKTLAFFIAIYKMPSTRVAQTNILSSGHLQNRMGRRRQMLSATFLQDVFIKINVFDWPLS